MSSRSEADRADALTGCLLGLALGDALGFVVEAQPPEIAREYVDGWVRTGRAGERSHPGFPFGQYSDDTQLARELLLSVRERGGWDPASFAARVAALVRSGGDVGAGPGTRSAGMRILLGAPWDRAGTPAPYAGNGAAMRAGPVGLLFPGDPGSWLRCAREQSRVTHQDPRSVTGAVAVAGAVALASRPGRIEPREFLGQLAAWTGPDDRRMAEGILDLSTWLDLEPEAAARRMDPDRRGLSPYVVPTVLWSLYAFLRSPDDYRGAVSTAIVIGGDTDTTAAMSGAIAGSRTGTQGLRPELLARLTDRGSWGADALERLARDCARLAPCYCCP